MNSMMSEQALPSDFLSTAFQQVGEGVCIFDSKERLTMVNGAAEKMLGWPREALLQKSLRDFVSLPKNEVSEEICCECKGFLGITGIVFSYILTPVKQDNKVSGFVLSFRDITEKKQAEQQLIANEKLFRTMAEASTVLIWLIDQNQEYIYANKTLLEYIGSSFEELRNRGWMFYTHPDDLSDAIALGRHVFSSKSRFDFENRIYCAQKKEYRWILASGGPVVSEDGEFLGYIGTAIDIHDRKMAEAALGSYSQQLERSNKELEQFAFVASHDLQEPLRKVMIFSEHLKSITQDVLSTEALDDLIRLQRATQRMQCLISDLLDLSRVTRRGQPFKLIDMNKILREVLADLSYKIRETKAQIEVGEIPALDGDSQQIHQMLFQLIDNALKFHKKDEPPVIAIQAISMDGICRIAVADQGIGIKSDQLDKIFGAFVRLHQEKEIEGTGIGLSLVQKIAERHGGSVSVESEVQKGSKFTVSLPIRQA